MMHPITRRGFLAAAAATAATTGLAACNLDRGGPPQGPGQEPVDNAPPPDGTKEVAPGVQRKDCLILENPTGRITTPDDFNRWRPGFTGASTGLQQIGLDALWYIDPDAGVNGVWDNACAAEKPIYNDDFTQMTVKLRQGLMWSDGVEFTAEDLHYTVDLHMNNEGMVLHGTVPGQCRQHGDARQIHGGVQPQAAEFAVPCVFHGSVGSVLDDAQAHLREGIGSAGLQVQSAGQPQRVQAQGLRPERQLVPVGEAGGLAEDVHGSDRRAGPQVRHVHRSRPERQAGHRADPAQPRRDPRPRARGDDQARQGEQDVSRLVPQLPVGAPGPHAAHGHLQQREAGP